MPRCKYATPHQVLKAKYTTPHAMAALIEDHADRYGGPERLARLLDGILVPSQWARLTHLLATDCILADQGGAGE